MPYKPKKKKKKKTEKKKILRFVCIKRPWSEWICFRNSNRTIFVYVPEWNTFKFFLMASLLMVLKYDSIESTYAQSQWIFFFAVAAALLPPSSLLSVFLCDHFLFNKNDFVAYIIVSRNICVCLCCCDPVGTRRKKLIFFLSSHVQF